MRRNVILLINLSRSKCPFIESDEIIIKTLSTYADTMNFNQPHQLYGKTFKNVIN